MKNIKPGATMLVPEYLLEFGNRPRKDEEEPKQEVEKDPTEIEMKKEELALCC